MQLTAIFEAVKLRIKINDWQFFLFFLKRTGHSIAGCSSEYLRYVFTPVLLYKSIYKTDRGYM